MTRADIEALAEGMAPVIRDAIEDRLQPLREALDALRLDLDLLRARLDEVPQIDPQPQTRLSWDDNA